MASVERVEKLDVLVIGAGFFGCSIAMHLRRFLGRVAVLEEGGEIMQRASYHNQARVHQGYHYPRSLLTGLRSRVNFDRFATEYRDCIDSSFAALYAIGRAFSHVTASQFASFCKRIGAPIQAAPEDLRRLFEPRHVEDVFLVREWAFNAQLLKEIVASKMNTAGVELHLRSRVTGLTPQQDGSVLATVESGGDCRGILAKTVFNCTYSGINRVLAGSNLPLIPLKHEWTEMALVEPPALLRNVAVTVMCGPFFSFMPFPARQLHSLSHVRYTPHWSWEEPGSVGNPDAQAPGHSRYLAMIKDAERYLPALADCRYHDSLWGAKTVLPISETSDSRPILFQRSRVMPNLISVMGGKLDNVFDVLVELDGMRERGEFRS